MKTAILKPLSLIQLSSKLPSSSPVKAFFPSGSSPKQPDALKDALNEDFKNIRKELEKAIRRICPTWLSSHSDDLIQGAIIRLLDLRRRYPDRQFNASYLWKTAYSALVDEIRKSRRHETEHFDDSPEAETCFKGPGPETKMHSRQIGSSIRYCLLELSETRRTAVTLYLQGYNVPETAQLLSWSRKKAENTVYRGLKELREKLRAQGVQP